MNSKKKRTLFFLFIIFQGHQCTYAQQLQQPDSAKFYKDIETFSHKNKFTKFLHHAFFKPIVPIPLLKPINTPPKPKTKKKEKMGERSIYFNAFEKKIIRDIVITTLDPFGYSLNDSSRTPHGFAQKSGNLLHLTTQRLAIKNLLLIKKNDLLDSIKVKESERLIRKQRYVRDVVIKTAIAGHGTDSVDIFIRVLDTWSITMRAGASPDQLVLNVTDRNVGGTGHLFEYNYKWRYNTGRNFSSTKYIVPNIKNTYITLGFNYIKEPGKFETSILDIQRSFYSPLTKWAGGSYFTWNSLHDSIGYNDSLNIFLKFKTFNQDYWIGRAFQIFKGNSENNRTTNLILSARYGDNHFNNQLDKQSDTLDLNLDTQFYLAGIGISTRKYRTDQYIFNFGITEDIPIGKAFGITSGYRHRFSNNQWYFGARASWGNYFSWGYLSSNFEYCTFLNKSKFEQGVIIAELNYFTRLIEVGKWRFRQFIKPQMTFGISRFPLEKLKLTTDNGIRGFNNDEISGIHRLLIFIQTQAYAPWSIIGFRFGPFFNCTMAMLADQENGFQNSRLYSQFSLGVLIKNDYLLLSALQLSFSFYPLIPGSGNNLVKVNRYKTYYYNLTDFEINKPSIINYN